MHDTTCTSKRLGLSPSETRRNICNLALAVSQLRGGEIAEPTLDLPRNLLSHVLFNAPAQRCMT